MAAECKPSRGADGTPTPDAERKMVDSAALLSEQGELLIRHEGRVYCLRRTRLGKLILTA